MDEINSEKKRQDAFPWNRTSYHSEYNHYLAQCKVSSCLENSRGSSLLDIACGDGLMTELFAKHFQRIVGVDASGKHLAMARKRVTHAEFHEGLIEDYDTKERFSSVFMLEILEHVIDPVLVLKKASSFLTDDGILIIHVPNAYAINRRLAVLMGTLESCAELSPFDVQIAGHRRSYSMESFKKDIDLAGLHIVHTGGIFYKMLSTPQMDWFLKNGLWDSGHGWGRTGMETSKDWKAEFCRACYEFGKDKPEDCNIIYACVTR